MISTSRTTVRTFLEKDLETFIEYRNNLDWMKYQAFKGLTKEAYRSSLLLPFHIDRGGQLAIVLKDTDELLGDLYIHKTKEGIYLGYTIHPKYSRKGYIYEVVCAIVEYLQDSYKMKIIAETDEGNIASRMLLLKCGFVVVRANEDGYVFEK